MTSTIQLDSGIHRETMLPIAQPVGKTIRIKKPKKNGTTNLIEQIAKTDVKNSDIESMHNDIKDNVLSNLNNYIEEPFEIIESYFRGQHLERLVRHQIESYNHFI